MRHAVMLNDLRSELFFQKLLTHGASMHHGGDGHQGGAAGGAFRDAAAMVADIRQRRARGVACLDYILHPQGDPGDEGAIHFHLKAQGTHTWLVRMQARRPAGLPGGEATGAMEAVVRARRIVELMNCYAQGPSTPNINYSRQRSG